VKRRCLQPNVLDLARQVGGQPEVTLCFRVGKQAARTIPRQNRILYRAVEVTRLPEMQRNLCGAPLTSRQGRDRLGRTEVNPSPFTPRYLPVGGLLSERMTEREDVGLHFAHKI